MKIFATNKELKKLYESGLTLAAIADKFSCSPTGIGKKLKKYGLILRDNHTHKGINLESNNRMWKGDEVGHESLHRWIKRRKIKPELCEQCNSKKPYDLANISGEYKRDILDFEWLCRTCHMKNDGRLNLLHKSAIHRTPKKLTASDILLIRKFLLERIMKTEIAKRFNVTPTMIRSIELKKVWSHIEPKKIKGSPRPAPEAASEGREPGEERRFPNEVDNARTGADISVNVA